MLTTFAISVLLLATPVILPFICAGGAYRGYVFAPYLTYQSTSKAPPPPYIPHPTDFGKRASKELFSSVLGTYTPRVNTYVYSSIYNNIYKYKYPSKNLFQGAFL
jgi:hypothetical protein